MSRSSVILRNIASNWVGFAVNAAVTLVLTPFVLRELGVARYGIWILTSSFIGYYGFLDLGFRAGVLQYLTRYLTLRDYEKGSDCISSAVAALSLLGALMAALSVGGAYAAPYLFTLPAGMNTEVFWCILIVGLSSSVNCVFSPFGTIFSAKQRYDLSNFIGILTRLLFAAAVVTALKLGHGIIGLSIAFCGVNVIDYLIRWRVARRLTPELEVSWHRANLTRMREIASFGGWNFLLSLNHYIYSYVPNLLIGAFLPVAAVGHYALVVGLSRQVNSVLSPIPEVVSPTAIELYVLNDLVGLENLYHKASRLMMLVMIPVVMLAAFWAADFYRLWIGAEYLSGIPFTSVAVLLQILLISTLTSFTSCVAQLIITRTGRVRISSTLLIIGSVINLTFSLILIRPYGLVGIAAATVIASVIIDLIAMPLTLHKVLGFSILHFLRKACLRPIVAGIFQVIIMISVKLTGHTGNFIQLTLQGLLAMVGSAAVLVAIGLTKEEQQKFLIKPIRQLFKKLNDTEVV